MNINVLFFDELLDKQYCGVRARGRVVFSAEEVQAEINKRLERAKNSPTLSAHYHVLMNQNRDRLNYGV